MKLTLEEISYLSKIFPHKNAIGLLSNVNAPLKGNEQETLTKKGFLENDKFAPGIEEFLAIVAQPERVCRLVVQSGYLFVEKYSYRKKDKLVLVENENRDILLSVPDDLKRVVHQMIDLFGGSNLKTVDFSQKFSKNELFTFFAIVDLYRKDTLRAYLNETSTTESFTLEQIAQQLEKPSSTDLVAMLKANYKQLTLFDLNEPLSELRKRGLIEKEGSTKFTLVPMLLARNSLFVRSITLLEILALKQDVLSVLSVLFFNFSVHDVLRLQFLKDEILVESVAARDQIQEIELAMACPEIEQGSTQGR
ncbi:hypothetical protein AJ81_03860 [Pseudothermotoga hypogea DSM 11164 = NBRC 106472]|uniref:Uncharacterized protein n=1 Tax=Pseudothermotoga hypogea DSM 11164 = NBRC 106472 TaxID=1123384 RepID=A0A0X1KU13_9THEM|nr:MULTISPECIES: hypothetical protein [Pseudothermotoga]AJC74692.1 hypothetical protein AJ81_03860 [Pseudothermotoga hypogea DSM 11164 = NBRC 106472]MDI6862390.1 hypothetical protein [Pseudothermotoga sp.]